MFDATPFTKKPGPMAACLAALRRLLPHRLPQHPHPLLLTALLPQVPRLRSVHQLHQLRSLAVSWLAAPQLRLLDLHLQERLRQMANQPLPPSPRSSSSRTKMGRRTGKRRR